MQDITNIPLVSSEISGIWNSYMGNSLTVCMLNFFVNRVADNDIRSILQHTLDLSNEYIKELTNFFTQASLSIPDGFNDTDVDVDAPRLFTDEFYLLYLANMARTEMLNCTQILSNCARSDIRIFFTKLISESIDLYNDVTDIRLSKGVFTRFPCVVVSKKVQHVKSKNFMVEWFGEKRHLLVGEITHISIIILANILGRSLITGFGQVSKTKEIVEYMFRGRDLSSKKIDMFASLFTSENIPIPSTSYSFVTDSTIAPFSEKLMLFHIISLGNISIANDGMAMAETLRSDIQMKFTRILPEVMKFIKDGAIIMIDNEWLEQPPQSVEHKNLV